MAQIRVDRSELGRTPAHIRANCLSLDLVRCSVKTDVWCPQVACMLPRKSPFVLLGAGAVEGRDRGKRSRGGGEATGEAEGQRGSSRRPLHHVGQRLVLQLACG